MRIDSLIPASKTGNIYPRVVASTKPAGHMRQRWGKWVVLKQSQQLGRGNNINQLNNDASGKSYIDRHRQHILLVIDLVLFCAKQEIPLRRHQENPDALNKGNFLELLDLVSKYEPEIKK